MAITWYPKLQSGKQPLYLSITEALAEDISSGKLPVNTRLPTHRELADELRIAVGTVTRAYLEAEKRGLIHGDGRRGTFVGESRRNRLPLSNPYESVSHLIDLSKYYPSPSEDPDLQLALRRLSRNSQTQWLLQYTPTSGLEHHRIAGAAWIRKLGMTVSPDVITITAGAQHAISVILSTVAEKGSIILTESYTYPGIKRITEFLGMKLIGVPMDGEGLLPDALDSICSRKKVSAVYCNPTLQNPTSATMSESRCREVAAVIEKYGIILIEDEINRAFVPETTPLIYSIAPERCYLIASLSKAIAAGLRVCYVVSPPGSQSWLQDCVRATIFMVSPLMLEIAALWIKDGTADETIKRRITEAYARQRICQEKLGAYEIQTKPMSYFIWLKLPDVWTLDRLMAEARAKGVKIAPADCFAVDPKKSSNAVRICLGANTTRDVLREALTTLADLLENPTRSSLPAI